MGRGLGGSWVAGWPGQFACSTTRPRIRWLLKTNIVLCIGCGELVVMFYENQMPEHGCGAPCISCGHALEAKTVCGGCLAPIDRRQKADELVYPDDLPKDLYLEKGTHHKPE